MKDEAWRRITDSVNAIGRAMRTVDEVKGNKIINTCNKLMKEKALRKHSLHEKTAASVFQVTTMILQPIKTI